MRSRLHQAGLWDDSEDEPEINITFAWSILSRLGYPARYGGKAPDGAYEYVSVNPQTGYLISTGKGITLERSICEAAINARLGIDPVHQEKPANS